MNALDWLIVLGLNGAIIVYGLRRARGTSTSGEWFLGARALPWWAVGLSLFATSMDNSEFVSATGTIASEGLHFLSAHTFGGLFGATLATFVIVPAIYRAGLYTNSEYLEHRFGPGTRVLGALIQIQYRTSVLGLMIWSVYLTLVGVGDLRPGLAWALIILLVVLSGLYTALGGLRAVVATDVLQSVLVIAGGLAVCAAVWHAVGGWDVMMAELEALGTAAEGLAPGLQAADLAHVSSFRGRDGQTSPFVIFFAWILISAGWWTVSHTSTQRMMGARSLWDMKMAGVVGAGVSIVIFVFTDMLGLFGRARFPDFAQPDAMYPHLISTYLGVGAKGLVVAGVVSAAVSTFDSMGSSMSAVFTRDIYARFVARDREDAHYVRVGRIATVAILVLGFAYLPFIVRAPTMLAAFRSVTSVFVTPLLFVYLIGAVTRANRRVGMAGLVSGGLYGVIGLVDREVADVSWLPGWLTGQWEAFLWAIVFTAAGCAVAAIHPRWRRLSAATATADSGGWLAKSSEELGPIRAHPFDGRVPLLASPALYTGVLAAISAWLVFGLFW
ncbi:sodium:solute symporter family transporter [Candidatus Palauibacter sp.]|uniref:sodium:solute symporter family transporter n=1 Tax=Candidatus Palauibacter sp. TaxID=3101350 RepID=UPI003B5CD0E2